MAQATQIVLNPHGNHSRDGRQWKARQRLCLRELAPAEVALVESAEEASQVIRQSALKGFRKFITVGDARTAHGVLNGIMELAESHRRQLKLGFLSFSRPDQWSRTLELPHGLRRQFEIFNAGHTLPFDVGRVECQVAAGGRTTRYFLNGAGFGVAPQLRSEWRDPETHLLQALPRIVAALRGALGPRPARVRLQSHEELLYEGECALGLLMGGRYYPSFGRIAPEADPSDGVLELAWLGGRPWWETAVKLSGLWLGPLRPAIARLEWRGVTHLTALPLEGPVLVEADGEPVGRLPATFSVVPRALPVLVAPVAVKLRKPAFTPVEKLRNGQLVGNIKSAAGM